MKASKLDRELLQLLEEELGARPEKEVPPYSQTGDGMLRLYEKIRRHWNVDIYTSRFNEKLNMCKIWRADEGDGEDIISHTAVADTIPKAFAHAVYEALSGRKWEE